MPSTTKHLLSGVAIIATLAIAAPVWAKTTATPMTSSVHHHVHHRHVHYHVHVYHTSRNNIANSLNARELARMGASGSSIPMAPPPGAGPAPMAPPPGAAPMAPAPGGPRPSGH
jgi:hypothetical protein